MGELSVELDRLLGISVRAADVMANALAPVVGPPYTESELATLREQVAPLVLPNELVELLRWTSKTEFFLGLELHPLDGILQAREINEQFGFFPRCLLPMFGPSRIVFSCELFEEPTDLATVYETAEDGIVLSFPSIAMMVKAARYAVEHDLAEGEDGPRNEAGSPVVMERIEVETGWKRNPELFSPEPDDTWPELWRRTLPPGPPWAQQPSSG